MNRHAKGSRTALKAKDWLKKRGYLVEKVERVGRHLVSKDLFSLFDIIALKPDSLLFIQVKTNRTDTHLKYKLFSEAYPNIIIWQMVWMDRCGWRIFEYEKGKYRLIFDEVKNPRERKPKQKKPL